MSEFRITPVSVGVAGLAAGAMLALGGCSGERPLPADATPASSLSEAERFQKLQGAYGDCSIAGVDNVGLVPDYEQPSAGGIWEIDLKIDTTFLPGPESDISEWPVPFVDYTVPGYDQRGEGRMKWGRDADVTDKSIAGHAARLLVNTYMVTGPKTANIFVGAYLGGDGGLPRSVGLRYCGSIAIDGSAKDGVTKAVKAPKKPLNVPDFFMKGSD